LLGIILLTDYKKS